MRMTTAKTKFRYKWLVVCLAVLPFIPGTRAGAQAAVDRARTVLTAGLADPSTDERAIAVRVLGLLGRDPKAPDLALKALADPKPEVRAAAAEALGQMRAKSAVPQLIEVLHKDEKEVSVLLACARAVIQLGDNRGYNLFYAVLTGQKKSGASLLDSQKKLLNDPKKMAQLGFEQGIGYVPFAGIGYGAFKMMSKDDVSPVRAAAAKMLTKDPDPKSRQALVDAASDKSWVVRMAALDSLARRDDPSVIPQIESKLTDDKDVVKYTAAAAIIRLSQVK